MTFTFDDDELDLLQNSVAELLATLLVSYPPIDSDQRLRDRFDSLVNLGRKLGMEL